MNPALINQIIILVIVFSIMGFFIYYWRKNNIFVDISVNNAGVFCSQGGRFRLAKNRRLYRISDIFYRKPLPIEYSDFCDFFIVTETLPFFGVKYELNLKRIVLPKPEKVIVRKSKKEIEAEERVIAEITKMKKILNEPYTPAKINEVKEESEVTERLLAWKPPAEFERKNIISDFKYNYFMKKSIEIEIDSRIDSTADLIRDIAIPLGLIILAMLMFIMLPRILEAIREPVLSYVKQEITTWQEMLQGLKPGG